MGPATDFSTKMGESFGDEKKDHWINVGLHSFLVLLGILGMALTWVHSFTCQTQDGQTNCSLIDWALLYVKSCSNDLCFQFSYRFFLVNEIGSAEAQQGIAIFLGLAGTSFTCILIATCFNLWGCAAQAAAASDQDALRSIDGCADVAAPVSACCFSCGSLWFSVMFFAFAVVIATVEAEDSNSEGGFNVAGGSICTYLAFV